MSDTIKPALTPEQWQRFNQWGADNDDEARWAVVDAQLGGENSNFHGAAALCLYGEPYGFTHDDVAALRSAVYDTEGRLRASTQIESAETYERWMELVDAFTSLANRIAALLPPDPAASRGSER